MRRIGFLLYPDIQALDVSGPMDVFAAANQLGRLSSLPYALVTLGITPQPVRCENGLVLTPDCSLAQAPPLDTLVIPGGAGSRALDRDADLIAGLRQRMATSRRVVSICTGLFLLAATGDLAGRRVTTHWQ